MKNLVCVIVYNRMPNIHRWLHAWKTADHCNAEIAVIHNCEEPDNLSGPDYYIPRKNVGRDIGAFQDLVRGRLIQSDWENLFWFTDDMIPMQKGFLKLFNQRFEDPTVGLVGACYEPSHSFATHFRTVAFGIRRSVAEQLIFPEDPMMDIKNNYTFESGPDNMTIQVERMGYKAIPVIGNPYPQPGYSHWPNNGHFMWDSGHPAIAVQNLWESFDKEFI